MRNTIKTMQDLGIDVADGRRSGVYIQKGSPKFLWSYRKGNDAPELFIPRNEISWDISSQEEREARGMHLSSLQDLIFIPMPYEENIEKAFRAATSITGVSLSLVPEPKIKRINGEVVKVAHYKAVEEFEDADYIFDSARYLSKAEYLAREARYAEAEKNKKSSTSSEGLFPAWEADGFED